jgi:hypothetical protein
MWIKVLDGASGRAGRANLDQVSQLVPDGSGSNWVVRVTLVGPSGLSSPKLPDTYTSEADATAAIDDLLLNGS